MVSPLELSLCILGALAPSLLFFTCDILCAQYDAEPMEPSESAATWTEQDERDVANNMGI
jgi:hypothetical protein